MRTCSECPADISHRHVTAKTCGPECARLRRNRVRNATLKLRRANDPEYRKRESERNAAWRARPGVQERLNAACRAKYASDPEHRARALERNRAYQTEYIKRPDVAERRRKRQREWNRKPEVRAKKAAYMRDYRKRKAA